MNADKDYYTLLGVIPSAEDAVIRAAYRALAQRYHPDRNRGAQQEANHLMSELNEAYAVLSDKTSRREYDRLREGRTGEIDQDEVTAGPDDKDAVDEEWALACEYYPDLVDIERRLSKISWKLASGYRAFMLDVKGFEHRAKFASMFEKQFLEYYFGKNEKILLFARELIFSGNRHAAKSLNRTVSILGNGVNSARVIKKICKDFGLTSDVANSFNNVGRSGTRGDSGSSASHHGQISEKAEEGVAMFFSLIFCITAVSMLVLAFFIV